jgi:hypothetical protein
MGTPSSKADGTNDSELVVSFEKPGVQEAAFDDVELTVEGFGTVAAGPGLDYQRSNFSPDIGTFSGGWALLAGDEKAGTAYSVDRGHRSGGDANPRNRMMVVENSGNTAAARVRFQISSATSDLKYLGFWWGSGNTGSGQNVIEFYRDGTLVADYDAGDIDDNLSNADGDFEIDDYMGNPNYCWEGNNRPAAVLCRATGETRPNAVTVGLATWVITQPYAFIHFRLEAGFDEIRFWRGTAGGFEFDNMTVSRAVPEFDDDEVSSTPVFELEATDTLLADPRDDSISFNGVSLAGTSTTNAGVSNAQLANSTITLGSTSTSLGATTSSVAGLSLTGSSNTIDLTSSGNKLRFNFANSGALPNATTYAGAFATTTGTAKAFFADSGGWNEIANENSSINLFTDVDLVTQAPVDQQSLVWVGASGKFVPGTGDLIKTAALIDVTNSGFSSYQFNSHYSGNNPTLYFRPGQTYAFRLNNVTGHPFHLQTVSGGYDPGNAYTTGLTHVSLTGAVTTGASALLKVSGILYYEVPSNTNTTIFYVCQNHSAMAGKIVIGNITETATGDGSTTTLTINSGRNVNDLLVFVNGSCLRPTSDYTISGTTLTFATAPAGSAAIIVRYL